MKFGAVMGMLLLLLISCVATPGLSQPEPPGTSATFTTESGSFRNPERGFHDYANLLDELPFKPTDRRDNDLVRAIVELDEYRTTRIPDDVLETLSDSFALARDYGIKIVLRFAYSWDGPIMGDTSIEWVRIHIEQLKPLLQQNSDVIATLQAGFIGDWGEWHSEQSQLLEYREEITEALLDAMPADRMVQIRTPFHARVTFPHELSPGMAFTQADQARIGFMNDCFLAAGNDAGTYGGQHDVSYARALAPWTVVGGETCQVQLDESRHTCQNALNELAVFHWDYLNEEFFGDIIDEWRADGCFNEIANRLGYRYNLLSASIDQQADSLALTLEINNSGFGKLYNPRPMNLVLVSGAERTIVQLTDDARLGLPGASETVKLEYSISTGSLPAGDYTLYLELPDAGPQIRHEPMFSIRVGGLLQGQSIWQPESGLNYLGLGFTQR